MQRDKNFTEHYKLLACDVKYIIKENEGIVVAQAEFRIPYMLYHSEKHYFTAIGVARVNKKAGDTFDVEKGKRLARAKAEKEAFIQFKLALLEQETKIIKALMKIENSIDRMNTNIQHQNEYIKTF